MRKKLIEAYKIFRVENGKLYSQHARGKAQIHYKPGEENIGKEFEIVDQRKKIRNPIFAYGTLKDAIDNYSFPEFFELWEVKGTPWRKEFIGVDIWACPIEEGFIFKLEPTKLIELDLPKGTILLSSCIPVRNIEITEQKGGGKCLE